MSCGVESPGFVPHVDAKAVVASGRALTPHLNLLNVVNLAFLIILVNAYSL